MNFLSFDIGTTCCKCQLFSEDGKILHYLAEDYQFIYRENECYVDITTIWKKVQTMIKEVARKYEFASVCISSFGEAFVLLDFDDKLLTLPMLYTDTRGEEEAKFLKDQFDEAKYFETTGTLPHSMYSISKLLWIRNNYPDIYQKADKLFLMGDYVGYLLSGKRAIDYSLATRSGVFDIAKKTFSEEILSRLNIDKKLFSKPMQAGSIIGPIRREIREKLGIKNECLLVLGAHDQVCSALGAGAISSGDAVDGLGTVECITPLMSFQVKDLQMGKEGYVVVPYVFDGLYCTYMLNYTCGSIVKWYKNNLLHNYKGDVENIYEYLEKDFSKEPTNIFVLPYFKGASTPYQNSNAKGAIINLTTDTSDSKLYQAILEGLSMEMRLNEDNCNRYGIEIQRLIATGGGANSTKWLEIKANVQNKKIQRLRSAEGGLCGCAILQALALKNDVSKEEVIHTFVQYQNEVVPDNALVKSYEDMYQKYQNIYKSIKEFY